MMITLMRGGVIPEVSVLSEIGEFPGHVILTDDPLRARMLAAHHLESAALLFEQGDIVVYSGSYGNTELTLASAGFGSGALNDFMREALERGADEFLYIGACFSSDERIALRAVLLAEGGSGILMERAKRAAGRCGIPVLVCAVEAGTGAATGGEDSAAAGGEDSAAAGGEDSVANAWQKSAAAGGEDSVAAAGENSVAAGGEDSAAEGNAAEGYGSIFDNVTDGFYKQAAAGGADALAVLTVAENMKTGERMEDHERRSRFYAAARLVFEIEADA